MQVEIWSDIVCPWCFIGKRRFETALARFPHADTVEVTWRSFELDPSAPRERDVSVLEHLANKYRVSLEDAQAMHERMTAVAAGEGLEFRLGDARGGNTFDAHRLLHLARDRGVQDVVKERLLTAYLTEGEAVGNPTVLARLVVEAGLDGAEVQGVLASDTYADAVRRDESDARSLGITGVPFFVVDRSYGVEGAQPAEVLGELLDAVWSRGRPVAVGAQGAACDDDSCALPDG